MKYKSFIIVFVKLPNKSSNNVHTSTPQKITAVSKMLQLMLT